MTPLYDLSKPFVLLSDGINLEFKSIFNKPVIASKIGNHTPEIALYSSVDEYGTTSVFYYFYKQWITDKEPWEYIEDPDVVKLRHVGHSFGDLLGTECFKR